MSSSKKLLKLTDVFSWGNAKMGDSVLTFSIPAVLTCPGRSSVCESLCYADKNFFKYANVQSKYQRNLRHTKKKSFVGDIISLFSDVDDYTKFRLHVAGDFYSAEYAEKWLEILSWCEHIVPWVYTRSWRIPEIYPVIKKLAKLKHLNLWLSCDKETGKPPKLHNARSAYMMVSDDDIPKYTPDLYFRDYAVRKSVAKYIKGTLVCPAENGVSGHVQCDKCKICLTSPLDNPNKRTHNRDITEGIVSIDNRIALALV